MTRQPSEQSISFFHQVYEIVKRIPSGRVTSYGAIAKCLGTGTSSRMVGWAMNYAHFITPQLPAHRVVNRNGLLTGKHHFDPQHPMATRLKREGVRVENNKVVDFDQIFWNPLTEIEVGQE